MISGWKPYLTCLSAIVRPFLGQHLQEPASHMKRLPDFQVGTLYVYWLLKGHRSAAKTIWNPPST